MKRHFFDIGANAGDTFDFFLTKSIPYYGWNVWCFEPSPTHMKKLMEKAEEYSVWFKITVCPFGIGGKTEQIPIRISDCDLSHSFYTDLDGPPIKEDVKYKILGSVVSISDFIKNFTSEEDEVVIKMDCEGSEYDILDNLLDNQHLLDRISTIYVEFHGYHQEERAKKKAELIEKFSELKKPIQDWAL